MYSPSQFVENDPVVMQTLIRDYPLATLVTMSSSGLAAEHIPLMWYDDGSTFGLLRGHIARANPLSRQPQDTAALVVFHGPDAYISPSWYATKQEHGRVVPTWNFVAVHADGLLRFIDDEDWLYRHLQDMTHRHEAVLDEPWSLSDAPADFIEKLLGQIVGIEIAITHLQGKWKVSQNQPLANRLGVIAGLKVCSRLRVETMADLMESRSQTARD